MVHKQKKLDLKGQIEIVSKKPYSGSGPRGIDVYTRLLSEHLSHLLPHDHLRLSRDVPSHRPADLIHYTFFDLYFLTLWAKLKKGTPFIVTVHDLIPLRFPAHFPSGLRGKFKYFLQRAAIRRAAGLITDSLASKKDIVSYLHYPADRIHVIPLAAGSTTATAALTRVVAKEYRLPPRYLLYVGDINWNKNVPGLIHAYSQLTAPDLPLVLVGKAFVGSAHTPELAAINQAIAASPNRDSIIKLGFVPSHHLSAIYRGATLYIQPSWYEGFGFPLLEALSQGTPVLSSDQGSLPEVGGAHVHYFNPHEPASLPTMLKKLLRDQALLTQHVDSGLLWVKNFSWKKVAQQTAQVYEKYLS